jgi:hypothetical protein
MDLREKYSEWKKLGFWNQIGIGFTIAAFILTILPLMGVQIVLPIELSLIFLFGAVLFLIYGNVKQSRELTKAKTELGEVDSKIDEATASVYRQKTEEVDKLEFEIASWKDKTTNLKEEVNILKKKRDELETLNLKLQSSVQEEHSRADESRAFIENVMNRDREQFRIEKVKLAGELNAAKEIAEQSEKSFELMKYAYDKLNENYEKLDKENQKLTGKYVLKTKPGNIILTGNPAKLEKLTIEDRIKNGDLSSEEAYEIATGKEDR